MRKYSFLGFLSLGVFGLGLPVARGEFSLFKDAWGDVIVSTDTTAEGRALTPPTLENPVYYLGQSLGCKLGKIRGDHLPDERKMTQVIEKILAKQGYVSARSSGGHEPGLYLVVQWGYLEPRSGDLRWFLGYDASQDIGAAAYPGKPGPEVLLRGFRSRLVQTILENSTDSIYGIIVTAFEFKSASTPKPVICWQTRIGLPSCGKSMDEAIPTMLAAAGTSIGQENNSAVLRNADVIRNGHVKFGELEIMGVVE